MGEMMSQANQNPMVAAMMRQFFPQLFGVEPERSLYDDSVHAGSTKINNQMTVGVIGIMVLEPTKDDPRVRLRITTNGPLDADPKKLGRIGDFFKALADDKDLIAAMAEGKKLEGQQLAGALAGATVGGK